MIALRKLRIVLQVGDEAGDHPSSDRLGQHRDEPAEKPAHVLAHAPAVGRWLQGVRRLLGWLVAVLAEPIGGRVVAGLVADLQHDPELAERFHRDVVPARRRAMLDALERGRERGEIRADADLELAVDALHGAVFYRLLLSGEPLDAAFTAELAEHVLDGLAA